MKHGVNGHDPLLRPILATIAGIALFSAMDAFIKSASMEIGAFSAFFLRSLIGFAMVAPIWRARGGKWPGRAALKIHVVRGIVVAFMGWTFFFSLVRLPLAEAIALSFISPLIALYLAAVLLGEKVERRAIIAAILGLAGVLAIVGGKIGGSRMSGDAVLGLIALLLSAVLYAWNLVLQRQQALVASPTEVGAFQNGIVALVLGLAAPILLVLPEGRVWVDITLGAALAVGAAMLLSWAYARAETQKLVPIEYSGFLWASLFGWWLFDEQVIVSTAVGAVLIVIGCWIATRRRPEQSSI